MSQPNQLYSALRVTDTSLIDAQLVPFAHSLKKKKKKTSKCGTKGLNFHWTSVFLECKNLSRVSFGSLMPVEGHYLCTVHGGKSFNKQEDKSER